MARLTVEDCMAYVNNRYDLTILACKRARQLAMGADSLIEEGTDKPTVIALREIAENMVTIDNVNDLTASKQSQEELESLLPGVDTTSPVGLNSSLLRPDSSPVQSNSINK